MESLGMYCKKVSECLQAIAEKEEKNIRMAAELMADAIEKDQVIHVIGTGGHSSIAAEEMLWRAGGLVPVNPMLEQGFNLAHGAFRSGLVERISGYAKPVLDYYQVKAGEVIIIVNAYGINSLTIDAALEAKKMGLKVIAITSPEFSKAVPEDHPARHPSKKNLYQLDVDVLIDNHMPVGDAVVEFANYARKVAPVSTILNAFVVNAITAATVEILLGRGIEPPVWASANMPGGDAANKRYIDKYFERIKHL